MITLTKPPLAQLQRIHTSSAKPPLGFLFGADFVCSRSESRQRAQIALFSHCSEWPVCELHQKDKRSGTENALCIVFEAVFETYFYVNLGLAFERSMVSSERISLAGS
jgi:hypothetical protein